MVAFCTSLHVIAVIDMLIKVEVYGKELRGYQLTNLLARPPYLLCISYTVISMGVLGELKLIHRPPGSSSRRTGVAPSYPGLRKRKKGGKERRGGKKTYQFVNKR